MKLPKIQERIRSISIDLLAEQPQGLRYSELLRRIKQIGSELNPNTINKCVANLEVLDPHFVYKPVKGLFRHLKFKELMQPELIQKSLTGPKKQKLREHVFYLPFANWLKNDLEEATFSMPLGGNVFKDRWGTPDVIGKFESKRSDVIKGQTIIVSAEIKADLSGLVIGFGQACVYKQFSHKVYLVIPNQTSLEEMARIDSLCQLSGIGLVSFNATNSILPEFKLVLRATKHEPDLFYTNRYLMCVEKSLFG